MEGRKKQQNKNTAGLSGMLIIQTGQKGGKNDRTKSEGRVSSSDQRSQRKIVKKARK
ncbi:hypothetical protein HYU19_01485 [Candidatus Woesearchaeota archaeon]|nr:hypothetical protein [Candidatus Woesearchaeota archaeon]